MRPLLAQGATLADLTSPATNIAAGGTIFFPIPRRSCPPGYTLSGEPNDAAAQCVNSAKKPPTERPVCYGGACTEFYYAGHVDFKIKKADTPLMCGHAPQTTGTGVTLQDASMADASKKHPSGAKAKYVCAAGFTKAQGGGGDAGDGASTCAWDGRRGCPTSDLAMQWSKPSIVCTANGATAGTTPAVPATTSTSSTSTTTTPVVPSSTAELEQENQRLREQVAQLQRDLTNR